MTNWKAVSKIGIAIWNYQPSGDADRSLPLLLGELVHIEQESHYWYYGYSLVTNSDCQGIFPKSYTFSQNEDSPSTNNIYGAETKFTVENETVLSLYELVRAWKLLFSNGDRSERFNNIRKLTKDTMNCYLKLKTGKLTSDELKNLKNEIAEKLDFANKLLNLDMVVRNSDGLVINPLEMGVIEYYRAHHDKSQRCRTVTQGSDHTLKRNSTYRYSQLSSDSVPSTPTVTPNKCYSLCVTLINFICTIRQDKIILMAIYDSQDGRFVTENYIVKWNKTGFVREVEKINNIRAVFTDLSGRDLERKLFLVCQVIRVGTMHIESDKQQRKALHLNHKVNYDELKRPCGVAVYDLTEILTNSWNHDEKREIFFPFMPCGERESLDSLIRKAIKDSREARDGFYISLRLISSYKMHLLDQYSHFYTQYPSYIARRLGFRDIILPEDVRNDLYLTMVSGEFNKGSKKSERNIEVTVKVLSESGALLDNCLSVDSHNAMESLYRTVVYYHEDRPKWMETIKVLLDIESFETSHLKFTFKHRSSNESKDKNEKPFAVAFLRLMNTNGTTLNNDEYNLFVYKMDSRKVNEHDITYLSLPSSRLELEQRFHFNSTDQNEIKHFLGKKFPNCIYTYSPKDVFTISVVICSTKLAQNIHIFELLTWKEKKESLKTILDNIKKLDGDEIVKFLHDALDALFEMWMDVSTPDNCDQLIFDGLIKIIRILLQEKYMHFQEILNDYIEKHFSATLIHTKLIDGFRHYLENPSLELSYMSISCMEFIFRFIVRSRTLYALMNSDRDREEFECNLGELLDQFSKLLEQSDETDALIKIKSGILKYFPRSITDLLSVFDENRISCIVVELFTNTLAYQLCLQKLTFLHEIIFSELMAGEECRRKLLLNIVVYLQSFLANLVDDNPSASDKLDKCLLILSDLLTQITKQDAPTAKSDILDMMYLLQPLLETFQLVNTKQSDTYRHQVWSIIISLLYQMSDFHFSKYLNTNFRTSHDLKLFLLELLKTFKMAIGAIYPRDWSNMNVVQNIVILQVMNRIVSFIKERVDLKRAHVVLWNEVFLTAMQFITQKSLQLEEMSMLKRKRIESLYKDMRLEMVVLVRSMWYHLGVHKHDFITVLVGPLLEVALIPVLPIRKYVIIIFFDMFYSCFDDASTIRNDVLTQLDRLLSEGKGDQEFQRLLQSIFVDSCENHPLEIKDSCLRFVAEVSEQIEKLLAYREVTRTDDNYESLMSCLIDLLDFYDRINRRELYIRYLYKLYDLHIKCQNYNEAAYTLAKHSVLLEWSDKQLESLLRNDKYQMCNSHRELKEKLYDEIIENFHTGQLWEAGIVYCKELIQQYENVIFDYVKLSQLFAKMSSFYNLIVTSVRIEPEYFHVTYYGLGFPAFFRGKSFIYRGKSCERLFEFTKRLQEQFPRAQLLEKLDVPDEEILNSEGQYLSIFRVHPNMSETTKSKFVGTLVDEKIIKYFQFNEINEFGFSRKMLKEGRPASNEFARMWIERSEYRTAFPLPGILCRAEVIHKTTYQLNPLKNAIDTMEKCTETSRAIIYRYLMDHDNQNPLHVLMMHINGIVNSDVQGGIAKYEEAFLNTDISEYDEEDLTLLKQQISLQIPLLELAIKIVDEKMKSQVGQSSMDGLYKHLLESFDKMREDVERKYGRSDLPDDLKKIIENHYKMQRLALVDQQRANTNSSKSSNRNSLESQDGTATLTKRSIFSKANGSTTNLTSTLRFRKKESRRVNSDACSTSMYASSANISQTQWYTDQQEKSSSQLSQMSDATLVSVEVSSDCNDLKTGSRPNSGHYSQTQSRASIQSHLSLMYRNNSTLSMSLGGYPIVSHEDDDETPPPLPAKQSSGVLLNHPNEIAVEREVAIEPASQKETQCSSTYTLT